MKSRSFLYRFAELYLRFDRAFVRHFFSKVHMYDILVVYEAEGYCGIITYDSFLKAVGEEEGEGCILGEKYIQTPDNNMWQDLREMFETIILDL